METETIKTAEEHINFLFYVLSNFGKSYESVMALIWISFSTHQSIATKLRNANIGFFFHRFHISVRDVIFEAEDVAKQFYFQMV